MNIYEKFKQVGRCRRAWFVELSIAAKPGQTDIVRLPKRGVVPRIMEILSTEEHEVNGHHVFTLRLAGGCKLVDAVKFRRTNSKFQQVMSAGAVAYSIDDVVRYLNYMYYYGLSQEEFEILDLMLTLWGMPDRGLKGKKRPVQNIGDH